MKINGKPYALAKTTLADIKALAPMKYIEGWAPDDGEKILSRFLRKIIPISNRWLPDTRRPEARRERRARSAPWRTLNEPVSCGRRLG